MAKGKKQEDPNKVAQRKAERVAFVQSHPNLDPAVARERFYVQTRAQELSNAGKPVDRAALRQKFESGQVTREGFYTPGDINRFNATRDNGASLADSKASTVTPVTPVTPVAPSATNVPTPVKPVTSSVKTPSSSYQAPQATTALGQAVTPSSSYMAPGKPTPVRGGEPGRGITPPALVRPQGTPVPGGEPRPPVWESGAPVVGDVTSGGRITQNGIVYKQPGINEGREFTAAVNRVFPQAPANPKALAQQNNARIVAAHQAQILKSNPMRAAEQARIDAGYVPAPYDWTNVYRATGGLGVMAADAIVTGLTLNPYAGSAAAGVVENVKNRVGKAIEARTGFGGVKGDLGYGSIEGEGDTSFKHAAITSGSFLAGHALGAVVEKIPGLVTEKIPAAWGKVKTWAEPPAPRAPWIEEGVKSPGISARSIKPKTPWREGALESGVVKGRTIEDVRVELRPKVDQSVKPTVETPKFTPETKTESGIIIPATRTTRTASETKTFSELIDDIKLRKVEEPPPSLHNVKQAELQKQADEILAGGEKPYEQMTPVEKRRYTIKQKQLAAQNLEVKSTEETVGAAKPEPVKAPEPKPAKGGLQVYENDPERLASMQNHPAFRSSLPQERPELNLVTNESELAPKPEPKVRKPKASKKETNLFVDPEYDTPVDQNNIDFEMTDPLKETPAKRPPRQRPNETDAEYAARLSLHQAENSGEVFKFPAGFEQPRGNYMEQSMERFQRGMSRTNRTRNLAFIDEPQVGPSNGGEIPPKPKGANLKHAAYDPETGQWRSRRLDKSTGEMVWVEKRTVYATEEERQAGTAARELEKQAKRKAQRAATREAGEIAQGTRVSPTVEANANVEYGPFISKSGDVFTTKTTLPKWEPEWSQSNQSLTTKPLSEAESIWLNRTPTADEEAFFKELGNVQKRSAGRRVVRSTREITPADIETYLRKMRGMRHAVGTAAEPGFDAGIAKGIDRVALTDTQAQLEKEIEQVLGTDALNALKNIAVRGNTPPLTQNLTGLESLAEIKAAQVRTPRSQVPLGERVVVRQELPSASGRLREQAAAFFNAEGRLKGPSGAERIRNWNRLTQSDWFRALEEREPTFAQFLREKNADIAGRQQRQIAEQLKLAPKPNARRIEWPMLKYIGKQEKAAAAVEFDRAVQDTGLGVYDLTSEEEMKLAAGEGVGNFKQGTTIEQRSKAAEIERQLQRQTALTRRVIAEDQQAFGDVNFFNRGFEQGDNAAFSGFQRGDYLEIPAANREILTDYGITDEKGFAQVNQAEFNFARRQLINPDPNLPKDQATLNRAAAIEEEIKNTFASLPGSKNKKAREQAMGELAQRLGEPQGLPSNPFAQEFGTQLPKDYERVLPESHGKTAVVGMGKQGHTYRWVDAESFARSQARSSANQAELTAKMNAEREAFYSDKWLAAAKKQQALRGTAAETPSPFSKEWAAARQAEEAQRISSLERKAAKIKAEVEARTSQTPEQYRLELKQKHEGTWVAPKKPEPVGMTHEEMLMQNREEEARAMREMSEEGFDSFFMDLGDYFKD